MRPPAERPWKPPDRTAIVECARQAGLAAIRLPRHAEMFARALEGADVDPRSNDLELRISLAPLVFSAASGSEAGRHDLAALTLLLWIAFDLLDDVADGDLDAEWNAYAPSEVMVMASALIAGTSHAMVPVLHPSPAVAARLHARIARGLCEMADGQIADIANAGSDDVTAAAVLESIAGKTGAECALFAGLAAVLAEASAERIGHFERFGMEYGIANQLYSDLADLFSLDEGRDVANGTRTLPIVWHLEALSDSARGEFLALLDAARVDEAAAGKVREVLLGSPVLRRSILQIKIHLECARTALGRAGAFGSAPAELETFLDQLDLQKVLFNGASG
jgi:geranylgeranyl pyrophosphate synthase